MMFVVKGAVNLSNNTEGELAIVSYQNTNGDHCMSFFFNKEEVFSDFGLSFSEVLSKLDKRPHNIVLYDRKAYLRASEDALEIVDLHMYTNEDKDSKQSVRRNPVESECTKQNVLVHSFEVPNLDMSVRAKSHMKQYQMRGLSLVMKLAWENPIKYDQVDIFPVDNYYADFEAMTDVMYFDYTIQDYTQPVKSVTELVEEEVDEEEYLQDDELEEIIEEYEEEPIEDIEYVEEELDEVEMEIPELPQRRPKKEDKPKKSTTQQGKTNAQPRDKNGKFVSTKKKTK